MSRRGGVGLVGAGRVAELHVAALRELGVPLVGVVASTPARSADAARALGAERAFDGLSSMLADPRIDAVHITTPSALHAAQVAQVLRAGRHVVCEKPLATSAAESWRLARDAERSGVIGAVAYTYRYHPVVRALRERTRGLGRPLLVRAAYLQEWLLDADATEWRLDPLRGGPSRVLADIGSHAIDVIEFVTGSRMCSVSATVRSAVAPAADDLAVVSFELDDGAIGALQVAQVAVGHENTLELEISGTGGAARLDLRDRRHVRVASRGRAPVSVRVPGREGYEPTGDSVDYVRAYTAFIRDARQAMSGVADPRLPGFDDCHRAHVVRDAILLSARRRSWVDVPTAAPSDVDGELVA